MPPHRNELVFFFKTFASSASRILLFVFAYSSGRTSLTSWSTYLLTHPHLFLLASWFVAYLLNRARLLPTSKLCRWDLTHACWPCQNLFAKNLLLFQPKTCSPNQTLHWDFNLGPTFSRSPTQTLHWDFNLGPTFSLLPWKPYYNKNTFPSNEQICLNQPRFLDRQSMSPQWPPPQTSVSCLINGSPHRPPPKPRFLVFRHFDRNDRLKMCQKFVFDLPQLNSSHTSNQKFFYKLFLPFLKLFEKLFTKKQVLSNLPVALPPSLHRRASFLFSSEQAQLALF